MKQVDKDEIRQIVRDEVKNALVLERSKQSTLDHELHLHLNREFERNLLATRKFHEEDVAKTIANILLKARSDYLRVRKNFFGSSKNYDYLVVRVRNAGAGPQFYVTGVGAPSGAGEFTTAKYLAKDAERVSITELSTGPTTWAVP